MPDSTTTTTSTTTTNNGKNTPIHLAEIVAFITVGGIFLLSTVVIIKSWHDTDGQTIRYVFASIIPLLGSWMGTILAFYFGKDNLAAATQSVKDITQAMTPQDKLKSIPVKEKMIPMEKINLLKVDPADDDKKKLSELSGVNGERVPVLSSQAAVRFLIYKAMIDKFVAQFSLNPPAGGKAAADLTLKDLVDTAPADMKNLIENSFSFVAVTATLADVKLVMETNRKNKCADVFVTNTGKHDEPLLGWVTDDTISENSKL